MGRGAVGSPVRSWSPEAEVGPSVAGHVDLAGCLVQAQDVEQPAELAYGIGHNPCVVAVHRGVAVDGVGLQT